MIMWLKGKYSSLFGTKKTDGSAANELTPLVANELTPLVVNSTPQRNLNRESAYDHIDLESGYTAPTSSASSSPGEHSAATTDSTRHRYALEQVGSSHPGFNRKSIFFAIVNLFLVVLAATLPINPLSPDSLTPILTMVLLVLVAVFNCSSFFCGGNHTLDKMHETLIELHKDQRANKREFKKIHAKLDILIGHAPTSKPDSDMHIELRRYPVDMDGRIQKHQTEKYVLLLKHQTKQCNTGAEILRVARDESATALTWEIDANRIGTDFEIKYVLPPAPSERKKRVLSSRQFDEIPKQTLFDLLAHNNDDCGVYIPIVQVVLERIQE
ncbi:MAG: hypothetical protein SGILL_004148 [Bacillariaceae sp.]